MHAQIVSNIHRLRRYALLLCRDPHDADDLVQATLERAVARAQTFDPQGDLRVWLFAILHNLHVSGRRSQSRRPEERFDEGGFHPWAAVQPQDSRDDLHSVLSLLDRLPEAQRQVLLLVAVDGLGTDQIAAILDIPVGTVRSRLARGRETLRRLSEARPTARTDLRLVGGGDGR